MSFAVKNCLENESLFDNIGNREQASHNSESTDYIANSLNQYTEIADGVTNNPTYDADGNMVQGPLCSFGGTLLDSVIEDALFGLWT